VESWNTRRGGGLAWRDAVLPACIYTSNSPILTLGSARLFGHERQTAHCIAATTVRLLQVDIQ